MLADLVVVEAGVAPSVVPVAVPDAGRLAGGSAGQRGPHRPCHRRAGGRAQRGAARRQPADRAAAAAHPAVAHLLAQSGRLRAADDASNGSCRPAPRSARSNGRRRSGCRSARWSTTATKANCCCRCASPRRPTPGPAASCGCAPRPTGWSAMTCAFPKAPRWSCCCRWWPPDARRGATAWTAQFERRRRGRAPSRCRAGRPSCSAAAASCC